MSHAGDIVPAWKKYTTAGISVVAIMTNIRYSIIEKMPIFRWRRGWIGSQGVENLKNLVEDKEIFLADKEVFNTIKTYFLTIKKHLKKKKIVLNYKKICENCNMKMSLIMKKSWWKVKIIWHKLQLYPSPKYSNSQIYLHFTHKSVLTSKK